MIIIGELINGTREPVREAILAQDEEAIEKLAAAQAEAGADFIDCNVGMVGEGEVEQMRWAVGIISRAVDVPVCIDTANPDAMRAGLEAWDGEGRPICNSVTLERERLERFMPIAAECDGQVVALTMTDEGVPTGVEARVDAARRLVEELAGVGMEAQDVYIDPVVTPLSVSSESGLVVTGALRQITAELPECHTVCGVSNISYGLPQRTLLNRVFLCQAMAAGLDSAIVDPLDRGIMSSVRAAEALIGRDEYCAGYLEAYRRGELG